jgi:hypothetical protein
MSSHVRTQIREKTRLNLMNLDGVGRSVYSSRVFDVEKQKTPAICIYTTDETSDTITMGGDRTMQREVSLVLDVYVKGVDFDIIGDNISARIEENMHENMDISGIAKDAVLTSTSAELNGEGAERMGVFTLTYTVMYHTKESDPTTAI